MSRPPPAVTHLGPGGPEGQTQGQGQKGKRKEVGYTPAPNENVLNVKALWEIVLPPAPSPHCPTPFSLPSPPLTERLMPNGVFLNCAK